MKGFGIYVKNDLLDPTHWQAMGVSIWLYLWLLDKMTSVSEEGIGLVLGGKPIKHEDVAAELGLPRATYKRYVATLVEAGYISTLRTPHGLVIRVHKASKIFKNQVLKSEPSLTESEPSNKTIQKDSTVDSTSEAQKVFDFYVDTFNSKIKLSDDRKGAIRKRLKDFSVEDLCTAITNARDSPFFMGDNPRGWRGDLDYLFRKFETTEKYLLQERARAGRFG